MKNIVICLSLENSNTEALKKVSNYASLPDVNITLLHVWKKESHLYPGDMIVAYYPNESQAKEIEAEMKKQLESLWTKFPELPKEQFKTHVFHTPTPKHDVVNYLKDTDTDLVICLTPEKKFLKNYFHSSFTNYLSAHAPCDVLALRV